MKTIGIVGANSQVGSEVCLSLADANDVKVIGICRTELASSFIRRCGIECRHGRVDVVEEAGALLQGCDVVADFAIPRGTPSAVRAANSKLIASVITASPTRARYVYISSINAFGMPKGHDVALRPYLLSYTAYGASKRHAERLASRIGERTGHEVYVLRLGQVHGELQGVSEHLRREASKGWPVLVPPGRSYSVFVFSIAEAIANIARACETPGTYTLVSAPPWSYEELYSYYCSRVSRPTDTAIEPERASTPVSTRVIQSFRRTVAGPVSKLSLRYGELIAGNVSVHFPWLESRLLGTYLRGTKTSALAGAHHDGRSRPFAGAWHGEVPGPFLESLSDSRLMMDAAAQGVRARIARAAAV